MIHVEDNLLSSIFLEGNNDVLIHVQNLVGAPCQI